MLLMLVITYAEPPDVKLITSPLNIHTIDIGTDTDQITVIARVDREGIQFKWSIDGPGRIEEDSLPRKIFYSPPERLDRESVDVVITVIVTDDRRETATASITFTLRSQKQLSEKIAQLLKQADAYFQRTFFTKPEEGNAFDLYKEVLRINPTNHHAQEKVHDMARLYKQWGDDFYSKKDFNKAQRYYEGHQLVASYMIDKLKDQRVKRPFQEVKERLDELIIETPTPKLTITPTPLPKATPTPTPTPTPKPTAPPTPTLTDIPTPTPKPTVTPIPSPTATPWAPGCPSETRELEELQQSLPENLDEYKKLREQEQQGLNLNSQIIPVIEDIICDLIAIESILEESYEKTPDDAILQRIQKIKVTRESFEKETRERLKSTEP